MSEESGTVTAFIQDTSSGNNLIVSASGAAKVDGSAVTQPVSGTVTANAGTNLNTSALALESGGNLAAVHTNTNNLDVALSTRLKPADTLTAVTTLGSITNALPTGSNTLGSISLGNTAGKANVLKTGSLVTTAVTADQVVLTYTVTAGKTFYLEYLQVEVRQTTLPGNNNPVDLGAVSLETPSGTKVITHEAIHPSYYLPGYQFSEPIPIAAGVVIRVVCTPASVTSITWRANFGGYEK